MKKREPGEFPNLEARAEANETVDRQKRYKQIVAILGDEELTAKEIAVEMYKAGYTTNTDRNNAAPRLTELSQKGVVEIVGKDRCQYTGKMVSVYALRKVG